MAKKGGWKRILLLTAVASFSLVLLIVIGGGIALVMANSAVERLGEPVAESVTQTIAIADEVPEGPFDVAMSSDEAWHLDIELEDGAFEIRPGPPGVDVQVTGRYARAYYELVEEVADEGSGERTSRIRFRPSQNFLVRIMASIKASDKPGQSNDLTIIIPSGVPIGLKLKVTAGESRIDLGGLMLTDLEVNLSTGDHRLDFSEPLAAELPRVLLAGRMGNIELSNLGNSRALELDATSSMGRFTADLAGVWRQGEVSDLSFSHRMGELVLNIPDSVRIADDSESSVRFGGESSSVDGGGNTGDSESPVVRLKLATTMGETRIRRY